MIQFTLEQVNELLAELGKLPYVYSAHLIAGIKQIAEPQFAASVAEKQQNAESVDKKQTNDVYIEPDISIS